MWPSIINALSLTAAIILVFILSILPARRGGRNLYLLVLLVYLIIHLTGGLLMLIGVLSLSLYAMFSLSVVVLYGPTFYFYIRRFHNLPTKGYLWHVVAIELVLWSLFIMHGLNILETPQWFYNLYYTTVLLVYFVGAIRIRLFVPLGKGRDWMKTTAFGFGILILLYIIESIWMSIDFDSISSIVVINATVYNLFCFAFLLIAIKQIIIRPETFSDMRVRIPYRRSELGDVQSELDLIKSFVSRQKEYKNPNLDRAKISDATGLTSHRISEIINGSFGKNFNDWLNDHRVTEAKLHLTNSKLSIKEICYEVGFNSKSVFNKAFKKRTGLTPSEYRLADPEKKRESM
ncbi:helix-turn-helix domain-containing protein [Poritiphilus flavus]|uniref:Helix-turn-helix domain-containing protein n=1 Tax=Poritiphilus flavus TaxID=2697053 RepID=A0A6L9EG11_9FLAO|nr:helix-turn-helix domain-containing protein [Poritiphilus flavus]NAS13704.1 helix-turn-helix domain-containing protein [Poritiphilus flavus]